MKPLSHFEQLSSEVRLKFSAQIFQRIPIVNWFNLRIKNLGLIFIFSKIRIFSWIFQSNFLSLGHKRFEKKSAISKRPKNSPLHPKSCKKLDYYKISEICFQSAFKKCEKSLIQCICHINFQIFYNNKYWALS